MSATAEGSESSLLIHDDRAVRHLVLNRPARKNALDRQLVVDLGDALEAAGREPSVRVVVLSGSGGSFCSGADLRTMTGAEPAELEARLDEFHRLIRAIAGLPQPVIAQIEGPAVGFGADLALACDLRVFAESGYVEEGFVKIGLMPDGGGTLWLSTLLGAGRAFELLSLGSRLTAHRCFELGLANRLVPNSEVARVTAELGLDLSAQAPRAVQSIKRALRQAQAAELEATLSREKAGQLALLGSEDFAEGVAAFLGKRAPVFRGL